MGVIGAWVVELELRQGLSQSVPQNGSECTAEFAVIVWDPDHPVNLGETDVSSRPGQGQIASLE